MRLSLRQLHIFCAIAQAGSTNAAANSIALSQSATSAALNELETTLGAQLFDRVGKRLLLNDAGAALLPHARRLVEDAELIEGHFRDGSVLDSRLRIGASSTIGHYVLPSLLASFHQAAPRTRLQVRVDNSQVIAEQVAAFEIDMGLIEGPCHRSELLAQPWLSDELVIVAAPGHSLAQQGRLNRNALRLAQWVFREAGSGTREEVEYALLQHLAQLDVTMEIGSSEAIKRCVAAGLGITCLSRRVVADLLTSGQLQELDTTLPPLSRRFYLLRHTNKFVSPALQRFWDHCAVSAS